MWIVGYDQGYYPFINRYNTYKEAKLVYDKFIKEDGFETECIYLAEVKEHLEFPDYEYVEDKWL